MLYEHRIVQTAMCLSTNYPTNQSNNQPNYSLMVSILFCTISYTNKRFSNTELFNFFLSLHVSIGINHQQVFSTNP